MSQLPTNGRMQLGVSDVANLILGEGHAGYFDRVARFAKALDLDPLEYGEGFETLVERHRGDADTWRKIVGSVVEAGAAYVREVDRADVIPFEARQIHFASSIRKVFANLVSVLSDAGFRVDVDGRIQALRPENHFLTECILGDCQSAPITRGDIQINEVVGGLHELATGAVIVDLGAGQGRLLRELVTFEGFANWRYVGVNAAEDDRAALRDFIKSKKISNCDSILLTELDARIKPASADVVLCVNVLHSLAVDQVAELLSRVSRMLKSGGLLVLHDFALPLTGGEKGLTPWDADAGADIVETFCTTTRGRNFETRSGTRVWTVVARRVSDYAGGRDAVMTVLSNRKDRLMEERKATKSPTIRALINEFCCNIDEKLRP